MIIAKDSKDNVIKMLIDSIFKYISPREGESKEKAKERDGLTLFAHNLGRFDGVELIKGILQEEPSDSNYDLKGVWKTDQARLLSLRIKHKKLKCHINIHDSLSFFNFTSLDNVLKSYKIEGIFPHAFIRSDNLDYIGNKPDKMYYLEKVSQEDYDLIPDNNWNLSDEIKKYLGSDIEGLYKAIEVLHKNCFDKYKLNLTKFKTLPSFVMAIFTSNYYDENHEIKIIKGSLENKIRDAYYGGGVQVPFKGKYLLISVLYSKLNPFNMLISLTLYDLKPPPHSVAL
jgi:hypothetical protein